MWIFNTDYNKWFSNTDTLSKDNFEYLKQELAATRFYSKCLSGATYVPVNNLDNIYDILGEYQPRNWFVNQAGSIYTNTTIPLLYASPINKDTSYEYYTKYLSEYGLTLKNLFTPDRLIKDANKNFIYVDVATTESISNIGAVYNELVIDGIKIVNNHRILIKDQVSTVTLAFDVDPDTYFQGSYTVVQDYGTTILYSYYNSENAIYTYNNGRLFKTEDLSDYADCIRYSVLVKEGVVNTQKQYHLNRLLNGYYPTTSLNEPIEFKEKHNWLLRHRVDYNNLFEINYYDVVKYTPMQYNIEGITYSIPERTLSIGEFGVILNNQYGISNIIPNKYKVNLRSITSTDMYYWICGDDGILLKVRKHDFIIDKIDTNVNSNLSSISFFNNLKGVAVGDLNTILVTKDGGNNWDEIIIDEFSANIYTKAIFYSSNKIYIVGNSGVFLELQEGLNGWDIYKRRVSRFIDDFEEYLLVDNINDMYVTNVTNWGVTFSYLPDVCDVNKELLFLTTDDSKLIVYDINGSIPNFDFIYLDFNKKYGDIKSIVRLESETVSSNYFYFNWNDGQSQGISLFDLNQFTSIGVNNKYSNSCYINNDAKIISRLYTNKIFNYNANQLLVCGNDSLLYYSNYSLNDVTTTIPTFNILDSTFESRLKSKMLFLDYDIASKLNFFTDAGEYRLPTDAVFDLSLSNPPINFTASGVNANIYSNSVISSPLIVSGLDTNVVPKTIDITVNLSNNSLSNLIINLKAPDGKIINLKSIDNAIGNTFSNVTFTTAENFTKFSVNLDTIYTNKKYQMDKFIGVGSTGYISNTDSISDLDDTLNGVWTLYVVSNSFTGNQVVTGKLNNWRLSFTYQLLNQISLTSSVSQLWFNPLVISATAPSFMTQSETNWLTYWSDSTKTFEYYDSLLPLDESSKVLMSTTFSYKDYNTKLVLSSTGFTNSITQVSRLAPSILDNNSSKFNGQTGSIQTPTVNYDVYLYDYIMILKVNTIYPVEIGDIIRLESDVVDGNFMVNKIVTLNNATPPPANYKFIYLFTNFNENIVTNLTKTSNPITITNLNKYKNIQELQTRFNIHPISNAYDFVYATSSYYDDSRGKTFNADTINISAKFNSLTSYYNLATNVYVKDNVLGNLTATMSYTDGFLKFGYTPTYNILDYLERISDSTVLNPKFYADKEYVAMPNYVGIPIRGAGDFLPSQVFIMYNGMPNAGVINGMVQSNKIYFGTDLKLEWESIFLNTFIDIKINTLSNSYTSERLLVMKKYADTLDGIDVYVIEFHTNMKYTLNEQQVSLDITSRRKLSQISSDLQELNNIQRAKLKKIGDKTPIVYGSSFYNYERELNFKISTDSYTKVLLSDVDTVKEISAILYIDYKNELAMNITRLEKEYNIPIQDTFSYIPVGSTETKFFVRCTQNHDLKTGDAVVLEFTGTNSYSSSTLNQQYFGYHNVTVLNSSGFYIDTPYGVNSYGDTGFVKYTRRDPFLNYQPVDITDIGVDKRGKNAIELSIDNLSLSGEVYSLKNVDFNKFRFRLIDGLTIDTLSLKFPWILEAEITDAIIGTDGTNLIWYKGTWECGRWFGGTWNSGTWKSGDWYDGTWNAKKIVDNLISVDVASNTSNKDLSTWYTGRWYDGNWNDGTWHNGRWYGGTWSTGTWNNGTWNDGIWNSGEFSGGIWVEGTWNSGIFNCDNQPSYWINGKWSSGDFENGIWYNGIFEEKNGTSRFGTKAFNSRTATWHSGKWLSGSFYSRLGETPDVSVSHKYSIWHTGSWYTGDIYGGIVYDIDFKSGTWHGGILEDIQIINVNVKEGYIKLNGTFKFNIGDEISILGSDDFYLEMFKSVRYKVIHIVEDQVNKYTKVYIKFESVPDENYYDVADKETNMRVVSRFRNVNWLSGLWTNGIFETGNWKGGIWYDGQFGDKAKWS